LGLFCDLGYSHLFGPDIEREYTNPLYEERLFSSLSSINPNLPHAAISEAINKLMDIETGYLEHRNAIFMDFLQNGVSIQWMSDVEEIFSVVRLIDYENINNNTFEVINQWTFVEDEEKRPDIIVFVNGLPLVVIELKSPSREETDSSQAYRQLKNYMDKIPSLFVYNAFCVISDFAISKAGTITANEDRYMEWKTVDGNYETTQFADYNVFFKGMFDKERFLDILQYYTLYSKDGVKPIKILAAYHQFFAVKKAVDSTLLAIKKGDGKAGVFWHTQGSGKSLSMVFYVKKLQNELDKPTFVVITDRDDLDDQLFNQFSRCSDFLREKPKQAENRANLVELLNNREANGIIFTTMQKFEESKESLTNRDDIIVISDEAHRGQYGLEERVDSKTGKVSVGVARKIRDNLPNAIFIGFTGTPISKKDKSTVAVFGDYIDIYDMTQSVEDGATKPIYYESRVVKLKLDEETLSKIDKEYDKLAENSEPYNIEKSKKELSRMEEVLGSPETIESLCRDIIYHYENDRQDILTGKAMIVAYSRKIAMKIYDKILELRPNYKEKVNVVMSSSNNDIEEWHEIIGTKSQKIELANRFKDNEDPFKIAIIVDMWLTGFDIPSLATMYIFKPMQGHTLMQAIARVNRVFEDKEGGLIVDYMGIYGALHKAMSDYTNRDQKNYGHMNIANTALPLFKEKLEICRNQFHGYDYSKFFQNSDKKRAQTIAKGVNFLKDLKREKNKESFVKESLALKQSLSLCKSIVEERERFEAAYFESVRTILTRLEHPGKTSLKEINKTITELLKHIIKSEGIINLFSDVKEEISLFDPEFLDRVSKMEEKNLALELLKKLLQDKISNYTRTNLVKSEQFSDLLKSTLNRYVNGQITNEEVITELINLANEIKKHENEGNDLSLDDEELAFYDALTKPEAIKEFYKNEELIKMTKELADQLRKSRTIDWQKKESARARMRSKVKRLLKKYNYPPNEIPNALETVIAQCEKWADSELYI